MWTQITAFSVLETPFRFRRPDRLRSIPASEALKEGYAPCIHCMKQYLSAGIMLPAAESFEIADIDIPNYQSRRTP